MTRIAPSFIKTVVEPTENSLREFVGQLHTTYQNLSQAVNGGISYGDGTNTENIDGSWASVITPAGNFTVTHGLNRIPVGVHVTQKNMFCDVLIVSSTKTTITLQASTVGATLKLFIFGLLLFLLPSFCNAQGANHTNIALQTITATGNTGLSGPLLKPIAGAVITVCIGSVIPSAGVTCTPANALLYSNAALTAAITNPTHADNNGNYTFFATAGVNYVVSVAGTGLTTYSYVWTAPTSSSGLASNPNLSFQYNNGGVFGGTQFKYNPNDTTNLICSSPCVTLTAIGQNSGFQLNSLSGNNTINIATEDGTDGANVAVFSEVTSPGNSTLAIGSTALIGGNTVGGSCFSFYAPIGSSPPCVAAYYAAPGDIGTDSINGQDLISFVSAPFMSKSAGHTVNTVAHFVTDTPAADFGTPTTEKSVNSFGYLCQDLGGFSTTEQSCIHIKAQTAPGSGITRAIVVDPNGGLSSFQGISTTGITNNTGIQAFNTTTTCTTAGAIGALCTTAAITLPVAYADTNYRLTCTGQAPTANVPIVESYTKSNTTFTLNIAALTAAAASFTSFDCIAVHN
jgi:hypothetical protein